MAKIVRSWSSKEDHSRWWAVISEGFKLIEAETTWTPFRRRHFQNVEILIEISLKFVHNGPINNIPALVQIMAWRRPGDKPLFEPMVVRLPTHICVTRPQWVKAHPISLTGPSRTGVWHTLDIQFPNELSRDGSMAMQSTVVLLYKNLTLVSRIGPDEDDGVPEALTGQQ